MANLIAQCRCEIIGCGHSGQSAMEPNYKYIFCPRHAGMPPSEVTINGDIQFENMQRLEKAITSLGQQSVRPRFDNDVGS